MRRLHDTPLGPRHLQGWHRPLPQAPETRRILAAPRPSPGFVLPSWIDNEHLLLGVTDQDGVGDCVAQTICECLEGLQPDSGPRFRLSRLDAYAAVRQREGISLSEDSGASLSDMFHAASDRGISTQECWSDAMQFWEQPSARALAEAGHHRLRLFFSCWTRDEINAALAHGGLCAIGFSVPRSMLEAQAEADGIVHLPQPGEEIIGGHAVTLYGYDMGTLIDGRYGAWKFRNHWSAAWGLAGNGLLPFAYLDEQLADDMHVAVRVAS
jgi:hypothetical protein